MQRNILLNPGPATTTDTVKQALVIPDVCPREQEIADQLKSVRTRLGKLLDPSGAFVGVPFACSGTGVLEALVGSAVPPGKTAVIVDNGDYGTRLNKLCARLGIDVAVVACGWGKRIETAKIEAVLDEVGDKASHLFMVHHETSTGMLNDIEAVCALAHARGLSVGVDAMSSFGAIEIPVVPGLDYVVSSSNKCIQGMAGIGFIIARESAIAACREHEARSLYFDLAAQDLHIGSKGQMCFTCPPQILNAMVVALDELEQETIPGRRARYDANYQCLRTGLDRLGFSLLLPDEDQSRILVAVMEPDDGSFDFERVHDTLKAQGFTIYPGKPSQLSTFRLAIMGDLRVPDVEAFLAAFEAALSPDTKKAANA